MTNNERTEQELIKGQIEFITSQTLATKLLLRDLVKTMPKKCIKSIESQQLFLVLIDKEIEENLEQIKWQALRNAETANHKLDLFITATNQNNQSN